MAKGFLLAAVLLLAGCETPPAAPVSDRDQPPSRRIQVHEVGPGETLYAIAYRYNMDYRRLAEINGISTPYRIHPGQELRLVAGPDTARPRTDTARARPDEPPPRRTETPAPSRPQPSSSPPPQSDPPAREEDRSPDTPALLASPPSWQWPVRGRVLAAFGANDNLNQGIDIAGELGEPVHAAAAGQVVYAGSGLRGYGKLVIIKHDDTYLSAYAYNSALLVEEGEMVKVGDRVAEMGSIGGDEVKLHFEIRRDGQPVDPIRYLPRS